MGIESDHLVYEYLSRVGDLAQRRQVPSGDRMRLVAGLRDEIDRRRAKYEPETPAAVRRILERMGTPEEVVDAVAARGAATPPTGNAPPAPPSPAAPPTVSVPEQRRAGAPPHLAGLDELGLSGGDAEPDWWRVDPAAYGAGPQVEGFAGGLEFPKPPPEKTEPSPDAEQDPTPDPGAAAGARRGGRARALARNLRERRRRKAAATAEPAAAPARPRPHAFLLLAAAVLVAGVVTGSWLLLALGWLCAYGSRVLGPTERKVVVFGLPGTVLAGVVVWLWGRADGRWGEALAEGQAGAAFTGLWPWTVRGAALASALYLTWRASRRR
ncbi:HAAS signaling domain-containing protein [Streptomyces sp. NPDC012888]|uniref:HAAS signaling domain-containing protein n=1 Tax=Streptomyces sp. NPDC012888 TaxID=3364855 RepID=UPI003699C162